MKQVSATIISNTEPMPGYHLICVEAPDIVATARAGQFVMVKCGEELILRRPLSIHKVANQNHIYFLFAVIAEIKEIPKKLNLPQLTHRELEKPVAKGAGTLWLSQRQEGEKLDLLGPLGNGFTIESASKNLLLVAGGIGVAPLTFLAQQALTQIKAVILLLGARHEMWLYKEGLPVGIEVKFFTEIGAGGERGIVSDQVVDYIDWADQIYACGPLAMYKAIADQRQQWRRKKPIQVSLEVRLGCGLGACYSCSIKTKHGMKKVCCDGPVFNLDDFDESLWQEAKI